MTGYHYQKIDVYSYFYVVFSANRWMNLKNRGHLNKPFVTSLQYCWFMNVPRRCRFKSFQGLWILSIESLRNVFGPFWCPLVPEILHGGVPKIFSQPVKAGKSLYELYSVGTTQNSTKQTLWMYFMNYFSKIFTSSDMITLMN